MMLFSLMTNEQNLWVNKLQDPCLHARKSVIPGPYSMSSPFCRTCYRNRVMFWGYSLRSDTRLSSFDDYHKWDLVSASIILSL